MDFIRSRKAQITKSSESASGPGPHEVSLNKSVSNSAASDLEYATQAQQSLGASVEEEQGEESVNLPVVQPPITGNLFI